MQRRQGLGGCTEGGEARRGRERTESFHRRAVDVDASRAAVPGQVGNDNTVLREGGQGGCSGRSENKAICKRDERTPASRNLLACTPNLPPKSLMPCTKTRSHSGVDVAAASRVRTLAREEEDRSQGSSAWGTDRVWAHPLPAPTPGTRPTRGRSRGGTRAHRGAGASRGCAARLARAGGRRAPRSGRHGAGGGGAARRASGCRTGRGWRSRRLGLGEGTTPWREERLPESEEARERERRRREVEGAIGESQSLESKRVGE